VRDLAQDMAEDVLGAAKDGNVKALIILPIVKAKAGNVVSFPRLSLIARKRKAPLSSSAPLPLRWPLASSPSSPCFCGYACAAVCWPEW